MSELSVIAASSIFDRVSAIRRARRERDLPIAAVARLAGVTPSTIQNMDRDDWNPTVKTIAKLEAVLFADGEGV